MGNHRTVLNSIFIDELFKKVTTNAYVTNKITSTRGNLNIHYFPGARVIMGCRSLERGNVAADDIRMRVGSHVDIRVMKIDLSSLTSVRTFAREFKKSMFLPSVKSNEILLSVLFILKEKENKDYW